MENETKTVKRPQSEVKDETKPILKKIDPPADEVVVKSPLISLNDYCNRIGSDGNNKFAGAFIEARLREKGLSNEPRTYEDWETFHNQSLN